MRDHVGSLEILRTELETNYASIGCGVAAVSRVDSAESSPMTCTVLSTSPLGIQLRPTTDTDINQWMGATVEVSATYPDGQVVTHRGVVASTRSITRQRGQLAIRITQRSDARVPHLERRRETRWLCSDAFRPTGIASNPARFNDFVLFQVLDISRQGMRLLTSLRNNFLVRGMHLDAIISFPMVAQIAARIRVQNVSFVTRNEKDYLSIGVQLEGLKPREASVISQYMAQFGDVDSLREFQDGGFHQVPLRRSLEFSVVRTEEEYREVLNLRHLAYLADGKIAPSATINEVADIHDSRARILIGKHRGKTVATARLAFHELGDITEHEEFITWPNNFPRRDDAVEVTRACTHPDYRRAGVFFELLRHIVIGAVQAGRIWVVTSSTEDLVPLYKFVGMREAGVNYNHPELNNLRHVVLTGNIPDALSGRSVGPVAWNQVWKGALPFVSTQRIAESTISKVRLAMYRAIAPLIVPIGSAILRTRRVG